MITKTILIGAFHEIIELAEENDLEIVGIIDNNKTDYYRNYKVICNDENAINIDDEIKGYPLLITPDKPAIRKKLTSYYSKTGFQFTTLISKFSKISKTSNLGIGSIIQFGVNISAECNIGKFVKLNTNCNIMHNCKIGDFTTVAPNSVVLGNAKIGRLCYIGANATILPNIEIGDNAIIGAGAVVTKNVPQNSVYIGNPAKELRK